MTDDAPTQATKAAMKEAGCELVSAFAIYDADCSVHVEGWDEDRDVCPVIDAAVRIGFEAGRRDALREAAHKIDAHGSLRDHDMNCTCRGCDEDTGVFIAAAMLRSWALTTTEETDNA